MDCDRTVHVTPWEGRNTLAGAVGLYKSAFPSVLSGKRYDVCEKCRRSRLQVSIINPMKF
jgi:hypothetical protein